MGNTSAVEWYAIEHRNLLIQLENKQISIGEYVVKHQDILQKAKSMEDLTTLKKMDTKVQEHILSNNTARQISGSPSVVDWLISKIKVPHPFINIEWNESMIAKAKQMFERQMFEAFKAGQDSMEEGGKSFERWYYNNYVKKETHGTM